MTGSLSGKEKARILLSVIGPQKAARIMRRLPDHIASQLSSQMAKQQMPTADEISILYNELSQNLLAPSSEYMALDAPKEKAGKTDSREIVQMEFSEKKIDLENMSYEERLSYIPTKKLVDVIKQEDVRLQNFLLQTLSEAKAKEIIAMLDLEKKVKIKRTPVETLPIQDELKTILFEKIFTMIEVRNGNN